jgi:hypothetical protein
MAEQPSKACAVSALVRYQLAVGEISDWPIAIIAQPRSLWKIPKVVSAELYFQNPRNFHRLWVTAA